MAAVMVGFLWITNHGYGFHRDELATLDDARHLAWGFVAYLPLTPFFGWISLHVFGMSLPGFRFFASLAAALVAVLTAAMTREFGGSKTAQVAAAAATFGFGFATGSLMQYVAFDYLWLGSDLLLLSHVSSGRMTRAGGSLLAQVSGSEC